MGALHLLTKTQRELTPREIEIVAAYMAGEPLSVVCKFYEISPAAIGTLMAARYGCDRTAEANSMAVAAAVKSRLRPHLVEQLAVSTAMPEGVPVSAPASQEQSWAAEVAVA
jgi:hypothetical protein